MSLICSRSDPTRYFPLTSSNRRRTPRRTAAATTSGSASIVERWVALNKSTFLDILNEILSQSAILTSEVTSRAPVRDRSPELICVDDQPSVSGRATRVSCDTLHSYDGTSAVLHYNDYTAMSSPFARWRHLAEYEPVSVRAAASEWICVGGESTSTSLSPNTAGEDDSSFMEVATDLTTVDRRRRQPSPAAESIGSSHWDVDEPVNLSYSALESSELPPESMDDIRLQSPGRRSVSADRGDVRVTTMDASLSPDVLEVGDDLERRSSSSSGTLSPDCLNTSSSTTVSRQSSTSSPPTERRSTSGPTPEVVSPRSSWMMIDKTLLCDVVDRMLYHDKLLGFPQLHEPRFPFPVHNYFAGSSYDGWSRSAMASTHRRWLEGDIMLYSLLRAPRAEPEMPQRLLMTSPLHWYRTDVTKKGCRSKKRSTYAANLSGKRRCRDSDCRNVFPFPVYVNTQNNDEKRPDDDDDRTPETMTHSPSLKWKSTMLLRMRGETETSGSCIPVSATT